VFGVQSMFSFKGTGNQRRAFCRLAEEYGLAGKKLAEFSELDKIVFQNVKVFAKSI